jgi:hypothetical protein
MVVLISWQHSACLLVASVVALLGFIALNVWINRYLPRSRGHPFVSLIGTTGGRGQEFQKILRAEDKIAWPRSPTPPTPR